jgi:glucose-1-phosphate adenylyltransferase
MKKSAEVLAIVLAGGEGTRLAPLTRQTAKPAMPFHAAHRLIDFALSNLNNSGIPVVHVLMQYRPESVLRHLDEAWMGAQEGSGCLIHPLVGGTGRLPRFNGTADAVYQIRQALIEQRPDVVAVFSADHVYRMDVRQMIDFHLQTGADATVAALPVPCEAARSFGVMEVDGRGRIMRFAEKPQHPLPMPGRPGHALASMGNYLFAPDVLLQALEANHAAGGTDFGSHVLPALLRSSHRLMAYDFTTNVVEGLDEEGDPHYWRDVGTLDAYFAAHMDTIAPAGKHPAFDLAAPAWPIRGAASALAPGETGLGVGALPATGNGDEPSPGRAKRSQAWGQGGRGRSGVPLHRRRRVEIGARCRLRNVIVEAGTRLPDGFQAGFDLEEDRERFAVSLGGVVVIPRGVIEPRVASMAPSRLARLVPGLNRLRSPNAGQGRERGPGPECGPELERGAEPGAGCRA